MRVSVKNQSGIPASSPRIRTEAIGSSQKESGKGLRESLKNPQRILSIHSPVSRFQKIEYFHPICYDSLRDLPGMLQGFSKDSHRILKGCSKNDPRIPQGCPKDAPGILKAFSKHSPRMLQRCSKDAPKMLQEFPRDVPKMLRGFS